MKNNKKKLAVLACAIIVAAVSVFALYRLDERKRLFVGKDIAFDQVDEFYYTYSTSTNPPVYQRYYFYTENKEHFFYYEQRGGDNFPLTEAYITLADTVKLDNATWVKFLNCIDGGYVENRTINTDTGNSGPFLYLYWEKDQGKFQEFTFASHNKLQNFEQFCKDMMESDIDEQVLSIMEQDQ